MKKLLILIVILVFCTGLTGCLGIEIKETNTQKILAKTAARVLAFKVVKKNSELSKPIQFYSKSVFESDTIEQEILNLAVEWLSDKASDDPVIKASVKDLLSLVEIDMGSPNFDSDLIRFVAEGFYEGAELAGA